jgi:hypothetical protein
LSLITDSEIRSFFTPSLSISDISLEEMAAKILAVEDFILAVYGFSNTDTTSAKYPALLLVAAKILQSNPSLASKYGSIKSEKLGDYTYSLGDIGSLSLSDIQKKAASWEAMAIEILEARSYKDSKFGFYKVND